MLKTVGPRLNDVKNCWSRSGSRAMFNDEKRPGFSMQGAWIQVFHQRECTQKMKEQNIK